VYIYLITNLINKKIYVGKSTKNVEDSVDYYGSGRLINLAINKYGIGNFIKEILFECNDLIELNHFEKYFISKYNSNNLEVGYNLTSGGDGGRQPDFILSKISQRIKLLWSDENSTYNSTQYRDKLSKSRTGRVATPETRLKISESLMNSEKFKEYYTKRCITEERRQQLSARWKTCANPNIDREWSDEERMQRSIRMLGNVPWNKGKTNVYSEDTIKKMSESAMNRITDEEVENNRRKKIGDFFRGKSLSAEHKERISLSRKNMSPEEKEQISIRMKRRHENNTGGYYKRVQCAESGIIYNSIKAYCEEKKISEYFFKKWILSGKAIIINEDKDNKKNNSQE